MKIAILVTMTNNFGKRGFYNSQEIGLARAFGQFGHTVKIYKSVRSINEKGNEELAKNVSIDYIPSRYIGANGFIPMDKIDNTIDALVQFADTQLSVPLVYKWCLKRNIKYIPYIGVTESESTNSLIRKIINLRFKDNLRIFRKSVCFAKNLEVQKKLKELKITRVELAPVGLDINQLNQNYNQVKSDDLKIKWGYDTSDRIILFIGRLEEDKRPIDLIRIFHSISQRDRNVKLLIIGKGALKDEAVAYVENNNLSKNVKFIEKVENNIIWELYRISSTLVNMSRKEIFGMALLEAMYYECGVVAHTAPGPDVIILDGKTGFIARTDIEIEKYLSTDIPLEIRINARNRAINEFSWKNAAALMINSINQ
ncbi:MAG: glycosyltransferase family 4 protein [Bacillus sp. (in: firmicutes)]